MDSFFTRSQALESIIRGLRSLHRLWSQNSEAGQGFGGLAGPPAYVLEACLGSIRGSIESTERVSSLLAAAQHPGTPDGAWFDEAAEILESCFDILTDKIFSGTASADSVLRSLPPGPPTVTLACWRHAATLLATIAVDAQCWAAVREAVVALARQPLPPALVAAMRGGVPADDPYTPVGLLCNNYSNVLRDALRALGETRGGAAGILRDPLVGTAMRVAVTATCRAVGSSAFMTGLLEEASERDASERETEGEEEEEEGLGEESGGSDTDPQPRGKGGARRSARAPEEEAARERQPKEALVPAAPQLEDASATDFPDMIRIAETCVVVSFMLQEEAPGGEGPDVVGEGILPLLCAALYQPYYDKVMEGFYRSTGTHPPFLASTGSQDYFLQRAPQVTQGTSSPWRHPQLQPCLDALRTAAAWCLSGGMFLGVIKSSSEALAKLQAMSAFQERLWQAAGKRPQALPPHALKQLVDACAGATGCHAHYVQDFLSTKQGTAGQLLRNGPMMRSMLRTLGLTLRCTLACLEQQQAAVEEGGSNGGGVGGGRKQNRQSHRQQKDLQLPPCVLPLVIQGHLLRHSLLYLLAALGKGMQALLSVLQGGPGSVPRGAGGGGGRGGKRRQQGRSGGSRAQRQQPLRAGEVIPAAAASLAGLHGEAASLLEGLLRFGGLLCMPPWQQNVAGLTADMLAVVGDPEFCHDLLDTIQAEGEGAGRDAGLDIHLLRSTFQLLAALWLALAPPLLPPAAGPDALAAASCGGAGGSSSGGSGSTSGNLSLGSLQGLSNSLAKLVPVWLSESTLWDGRREVTASLIQALGCCLTLVERQLGPLTLGQGLQGGSGAGGGASSGSTSCTKTSERDLANACFRLPAAATTLAAAAYDGPTREAAAACSARLQALGVSEDTAGAVDRTGVGCCNAGCTNLSGWEEARLQLSVCSGCRRARYCCPKCQKEAWPRHRAACRAAAAEAAAGGDEA